MLPIYLVFSFFSEKILTSDGGEILLDWIDNDERSPTPRDIRPTVLILPGLTGKWFSISVLCV